MNKTIFFIVGVSLLQAACNTAENSHTKNDPFHYTKLSRLTDPGENALLLKDLPDNIDALCQIANVQLVHYRMLSQWKIPKNKWKTALAEHDIKSMLDTLKVKGSGRLSRDRKLQDRVMGACTKESIFSTGLLRAKGIPARMRVGYLTNLYRGSQALDFWKNVKQYEWRDTSSAYPDSFTLNAIKVNRSVEHWVTEYWDSFKKQWRLLYIRPEYINAYGYEVDYFIEETTNFEFAWQVWQRINENDFEPSAYAEGDLDAKSHVRYQMLMDFYSLLNHDIPGVFDETGQYIGHNNNDEITFLKKKYVDLSSQEFKELDYLAQLLSKNPIVEELIDFYQNSHTLKIKSIESDPYSFIYKSK